MTSSALPGQPPRLMLPAQFCFYQGSILSAVQYAKGRFVIPSLAPVVYNLMIILGGLLLALILMLLFRTRSLPGCGRCGFQGVRRSQPQGLLDTFVRVLLLYPHRCEKCLRRFYCFRSRQVPELSAP